MLPDALKALLILQERDTRRAQLEKVLTQAPRERVSVEARIVAHKSAIEAARKGVMDLELKRKQLEADLRELEGQIGKYRNQQLQVKKNDEYQALTHEIELTEGKIGAAEEVEINLLYELDVEKEKAKANEKKLNEDIAGENAQLARIAEREKQVRGDLDAANVEVAAARSAVTGNLLPRYDQLAKSAGLPVVVVLRDHKCGGCHLKVSNGIETEARKGTEIVSCDNCGRIVFHEA